MSLRASSACGGGQPAPAASRRLAAPCVPRQLPHVQRGGPGIVAATLPHKLSLHQRTSDLPASSSGVGGAGGDAMLPASRHGCDASQLPCRRCNHHLAGLPRCLRARLFTPGHAVPPEALPLRSHSGTTLQRESVDPNARSLLVVDDDGRSCGPTF